MDKIFDPTIAARAYGNMANIGRDTKTAGEETGESGDSFLGALKEATQKSIDTMRSGETMSAKAVTGEADITDVVQAVTAAELTLQTVVSIRDRMVSAYQEIMRMPI